MPHFYFLWFELLSFAISLAFVTKLRQAGLVLFVPFLLLTNMEEWGSLHGYFTFHGSNTWVVNIFTNIEFLFYSYLFYSSTKDASFKKRIKYIFAGYILLALINIFFIQKPENFHSYTYLLGSLMIIYYCCNFYYELIKTVQYINLARYPLFWIVSGLLFYYCGMFCYYIFYETYARHYFTIYWQLFNVLTNIFNILLYSCFSIAFLCQQQKPI